MKKRMDKKKNEKWFSFNGDKQNNEKKKKKEII